VAINPFGTSKKCRNIRISNCYLNYRCQRRYYHRQYQYHRTIKLKNELYDWKNFGKYLSLSKTANSTSLPGSSPSRPHLSLSLQGTGRRRMTNHRCIVKRKIFCLDIVSRRLINNYSSSPNGL